MPFTYLAIDENSTGFPTNGETQRSNNPFPPRNSAKSYFELTLEKHVQSDDSEPRDPHVAIGLFGEFSYCANSIIGCNIWTVGYRGDNGEVYEEDRYSSSNIGTFGVDDTVGCGINYEKGEYYFTLNGELVGKPRFQTHSIFETRLYYLALNGLSLTILFNSKGAIRAISFIERCIQHIQRIMGQSSSTLISVMSLLNGKVSLQLRKHGNICIHKPMTDYHVHGIGLAKEEPEPELIQRVGSLPRRKTGFADNQSK